MTKLVWGEPEICEPDPALEWLASHDKYLDTFTIYVGAGGG